MAKYITDDVLKKMTDLTVDKLNELDTRMDIVENTEETVETLELPLNDLESASNMAELLKAEGNMLQNLFTQEFSNFTITGTGTGFYCQAGSMDLLKPNTKYTYILYNVPSSVKRIFLGDGFSAQTFIPSTQVYAPKTVFTTGETVQKLIFVPHFYVDSQLSNLDNYLNVKGVLIEGDYSDTFVPYFTGVTHVDNVKIRSIGKNLFNKEEAYNLSTWNENEGGYAFIPYYIGKGKTVKVSYADTLQTGLNLHVCVSEKRGKGNMDAGVWLYHNTVETLISNSISVTLTKGDYLYLCCANVSYNNGAYLRAFMENIGETLQIEISDTKTDYEPYEESVITINEPLRRIGKVCDTIENGKITRRIGVLTLNGSEKWYYDSESSTETYARFIVSMTTERVDNIFMNDRIFNRIAEAHGEYEYIFRPSGSTLYLQILASKLPSVGVIPFKAWLSENPLTCYYKLVNPVIEPIEYTDVIETFPNGHICLDGTIIPKVSVNYENGLVGKVNTLQTEVVELQNKAEEMSEDIEDLESVILDNATLLTTKADITYVDDSVDSIRIGGRNLIIDSTVTRNKWLNADDTTQDLTGCYITDYIPVNGNEEYVLQVVFNNPTNSRINEYDTNKTFIKSNSNNYDFIQKITTSSTTKYIRATFKAKGNDLTGIMLEKGNKPSSYVPAIEDIEAKITTNKTNITANTNLINTTNTNLTNKINNIQVGGENLLLNSSFKKDTVGWVRNALENSLEFVNEDGYDCTKVTLEFDKAKYIRQDFFSKIKDDDYTTQEYTVSMWVKGVDLVAGTTDALLQFYLTHTFDNNGTTTSRTFHSIKACNPILSYSNQGWHKISYTFKADYKPTTSAIFYVYMRDYTGTLYIRDVKLERGNMATDWSPSHEDIETEYGNRIAVVNNTVTSNVNRLNVIEENLVETATLDKYENKVENAGNLLEISNIEGNALENLSFVKTGENGYFMENVTNGYYVEYYEVINGNKIVAFDGKIKPDTTYTILYEQLKKNDNLFGSIILFTDDGDGTFSSVKEKHFYQGEPATFTTVSSFSKVTLRGLRMLEGENTEANNGFRFMILEGDWTTNGKEFPTYFEGVKGAESIHLETVGKNLFDTTVPTSEYISNKVGKAHFYKEGDIYYTVPVQGNTYYYMNPKYIPVKAGEQISMSKTVLNGSPRYIIDLYIDHDNKYRKHVTNLEFNVYYDMYYKHDSTATFTIPTGVRFMRVGFCSVTHYDENGVSLTSPNEYMNIQVEKVASPTTYEPFKNSTLHIPLNKPLLKLPDGTCDTIENGKIIRRVGSVDLSTLTWTGGSESAWLTSTSLTDAKYPTTNTELGNCMIENYKLRMASGFSVLNSIEFAMDVSDLKIRHKINSLVYFTVPSGMFYYELVEPYEEEIHFNEIVEVFDNKTILAYGTVLPDVNVSYNIGLVGRITKSETEIANNRQLIEDIMSEEDVELYWNTKKGW